MTSPYYDHGGITIYHGDCREILPSLPIADLVLTDPPYGIGRWSSTGGNSLSAAEVSDVNRWDASAPDDAIRAAVAHGRVAIVWGGNYLCGILGPWRAPLVWDKVTRGMHYAEGEIAWTNFDFGAMRIFRMHISESDVRGSRVHPTQKPVRLMSWCIARSKCTGDILDPFLGSGTTLRAAKERGMRAVGIEMEERYCEAAAKRMAQETLDWTGNDR